MAPKLEDRIAGLEERFKRLRTRQSRLEARKRSLASHSARKDDTRRKILIGAVVQAKIDQGVLEAAVLRRWLDASLTRADDRALFDLSRPSP